MNQSISNNQFSISSYRMFKQDRNCFGGRLIEHIVIHIVLHIDKEPEAICLEINTKLRKWPIVGLYKRLSQIEINIRLRNWSPIQNNFLFLENMSKDLLRYLDSYENITLLVNFNMIPFNKNLQHFTDTFSLEHLINEPTCFSVSPSCIDLFITNRKS